MIGVVVPAHNEERYIAACLASLLAAARSPRLSEDVQIVVVLDACTDRTGAIAESFGIHTLRTESRNVGMARAAGARHCLAAGARWLAFTDADTLVDADWLAEQLRHDSDAVCGTVAVDNWSGYESAMQQHFEATYTDADGHRHIHGANLGVSAEAYRLAGGFQPLASSEDVALVAALLAGGWSIAWTASPRVVTSARKDFRAPGGFGATLVRVDAAAIQLQAEPGDAPPRALQLSHLPQVAQAPHVSHVQRVPENVLLPAAERLAGSLPC
ncbi:MAG: glycosyltransferase family 2 protein [Comamonadaceae bacterium]|nr:MAG: glycosyltransferase family 2 protein [Comamonadaceae bacterium]